MARYHDGPVNTVSCSKIEDITLTVGGKTFALWHKDLPNRPILWRKNKHLYTTSEWNMFEVSKFYTFDKHFIYLIILPIIY